jgi:hypothetical protein
VSVKPVSQNYRSETERLASLLSSHGARRDKLLATESERAQDRFRTRGFIFLIATTAYILTAVTMLTPWMGNQLYTRTRLSIIALVTFMVIQLIWIVTIKLLYSAWASLRDLRKLIG